MGYGRVEGLGCGREVGCGRGRDRVEARGGDGERRARVGVPARHMGRGWRPRDLCCSSRVAGQTAVGLSPEITSRRSHSRRFLFDSVWQMSRRRGVCVLSFSLSLLKLRRSLVLIIRLIYITSGFCWFRLFVFLFRLFDVLVLSTIVYCHVHLFCDFVRSFVPCRPPPLPSPPPSPASRCTLPSITSDVFRRLSGDAFPSSLIAGGAHGPTQVTVNAGDEDATRDALEALNVIAAKQPQLLTEGEGLDVTGKAMLSLAASPALEVSVGDGSGGGVFSFCVRLLVNSSCVGVWYILAIVLFYLLPNKCINVARASCFSALRTVRTLSLTPNLKSNGV